MPEPCTVLIAAPERLRALASRVPADLGELLAFADADALRALEVITTRLPHTIALERAFAATPRGVALMNRLKADPVLGASTICVVSEETPFPIPAKAPAQSTAAAPSPLLPQAGPSDDAVDVTGTRRAPRINVAAGLEVLVDGNPAVLIDLSGVGAQVLSPTILRPNQRVRFTLHDEHGTWRLIGTVVWANFEIPPRYRAGIDFADPNQAAIDAYCARHRA